MIFRAPQLNLNQFHVFEYELYPYQFTGDDVPPTPLTPQNVILPETNILREKAALFGHLIGYKQEQNGMMIQNLVPNHKTEYQQISTSSKAQLELHTETAFHPYRPDYVLLMCLRGDPDAFTTIATITNILRNLSGGIKEILREKIFTTSLDISFQNAEQPDRTITTSILNGSSLIYDKTLMKGTTPQAVLALEHLDKAIKLATRKIALMTGDILVINNHTCVHGRAPFQPRYDGTDRWLQRALVVKELPPPDQRNGNVITTTL
jgi:alpha-ketoglutarate-dependent taurine dioxygenase